VISRLWYGTLFSIKKFLLCTNPFKRGLFFFDLKNDVENVIINSVGSIKVNILL